MILCANPMAQYLSYKAEIDAAVSRVLAGNRYILGPEVQTLEEEFAQFIGAGQAIGVANGTDAIELALRGLGIGAGDEVITVSHTAVATVAAVESAGATPVLVDVDPMFYTLDPAHLDVALTKRTRAVIAVHLYGQAADLAAIGSFCEKNGLALIEDASQAHGAKWNGKRLGSIGHIACFSCYPTKNLGAIGDGGLLTTSDHALAEKVRMLREYGWKQRYVSDIPGRNSRLDELQAAILRVKLRHLDNDTVKRRELAVRYADLLACWPVQLPQIRPGCEHVFHLYVVQTSRRAEIIGHLKARGIYPGVHYPVPVHRQPAYSGRIRTASPMQHTDALASDVLSLPLYPELGAERVELVAGAMAQVLGKSVGE